MPCTRPYFSQDPFKMVLQNGVTYRSTAENIRSLLHSKLSGSVLQGCAGILFVMVDFFPVLLAVGIRQFSRKSISFVSTMIWSNLAVPLAMKGASSQEVP